MNHPDDLARGGGPRRWRVARRSRHRAGRGKGRSPARWSAAELAAVLLVLSAGGFVWTAIPDPGLPVAGPEANPGVGTARVSFGFCRVGGGNDCVIDGDTFRLGGVKIRIADIDTPETHPARCLREAELGEAATRRLHALLNAGPLTLVPIDRDIDRYGRKLRKVVVDGHGVGETLIAEGLARRYEGGRRAGWCD